MLNLYTLADIMARVRKLTARPSVNQLSDADLKKYINSYYQLALPLEIRPLELRGWFTFDTVASTDTYDLTTLLPSGHTSGIFADYYLTIETPSTISGYALDMYLTPDYFYEIWPETTTYDESRPAAVLFYDNKLLFRDPPDGIYHVKFAAWKRPIALASASSYPIQEEWGKLISYGTACNILEDFAEVERLNELMPLKHAEEIMLMRKNHFQETNQRAVPKF